MQVFLQKPDPRFLLPVKNLSKPNIFAALTIAARSFLAFFSQQRVFKAFIV
jgi:hypothetical protein